MLIILWDRVEEYSLEMDPNYASQMPSSRGVFLTQGSNPGLLHWQAESFPVRHEGLDPREFPSMDIIFLSVHKMVSILKLSGKKMSQSQLRRKDNACLSMEGLIFI